MARLSEKEAADRLSAIERGHGLFGLTLDGWVAWRAVRSVVSLALTGFAIDRQRASSSRGSWARLAVEIPLLFWNVVFGRQRDLFIKTYTSAFRERLNGKLRDIYFDSLLMSGIEAHKVCQQNSSTRVRRADSLYPFGTDQTAIAAVARLLAACYIRRDTRKAAERIAAALVSLPEPLGYSWIARRLESVRWQAWLYRLLLRAVRPKAVIVADAGEYALRIAAARSGVRFVELQHGIFTENHPDAVPAHALEHASADALLLPDVLCVYGTYWASRLKATALSSRTLVPVGSDVLDRWRDQRRALLARRDERLEILVTTQGLERDGLIDWLRNVAARAVPNRPWRMVLKLHPIYDADPGVYAALASVPQIEVLGSDTQTSVYELLIRADLHASISSASHYDALGLGVRTVIIPLPGSELVRDLAAKGLAVLGNDPAVVWECALRARQATHAGAGDELYAEGFVQRMRSVLA